MVNCTIYLSQGSHTVVLVVSDLSGNSVSSNWAVTAKGKDQQQGYIGGIGWVLWVTVAAVAVLAAAIIILLFFRGQGMTFTLLSAIDRLLHVLM